MALTLTVSLADQHFAKTKTIGVLNVSLGLCRALSQHPALNRLTLLANPSLPRIGEPGNSRIQQLEFSGVEKFRRFWWDQSRVYSAARRTGNEWLLLPKGYASFLRRCPVKLATYIHDGMQMFYRDHYPKGVPRFETAYFLASLRASIRESKVILVNTRFTASEITRFARESGLEPPPIVPVALGFDRPPSRSPAQRTRVVVLASPFPHKRSAAALEYLAEWQSRTLHAGPVDWVGQLPAGLKMPGHANWKLHGRLAEEEWGRLLNEASAVVYFSEYEGFGMPPVEAALAGACPVYSSLPATEEAMQGIGCSFQNESYESFAAALDRALETPAEQIRTWADQLLARYTWEKVAERTVAAIEAAS